MVFLWRKERRWLDVVLPLGGIAVAGYTIYRNVYPAPASPFDIFPYVVLGWLGVGVAVALLVPGFAERLGAQLTLRSETS
jgi:predicted membrane channel-forming protein YqfA (hemolysin III family)